MTVGKIDYLLFGYFRDAIHFTSHITPFLVVDKCVDKQVSTSFVAFKGSIERKFFIVHHGLNQVFIEVAFLQLADFIKE